MTGYLDGILARAVEGVSSVRPRVTGFFEPPSAGGEASVETEVAAPIAPHSAMEAEDRAGAFSAGIASEPRAALPPVPAPRAEREVSRRDGADLRLDARRRVEVSESAIEPTRTRVPLPSPADLDGVPLAAAQASRPSPSPQPQRASLEPSFREALVPSFVRNVPRRHGDMDAPSAPAPNAREEAGASGSVSRSMLGSSPLFAPFEDPAPATMPRPAALAPSLARGLLHIERAAPHSVERTPMSTLTHRRPDVAREARERTFESSFARGAVSPDFGGRSDGYASRGSREAPTLSVTIGRVEIRAVTTPAPAKRPPTPAQRLSLDVYLAGRRERRP
jgi:hypothetical protein